MDLKTFITESLVQIAEGIEGAAARLKTSKAIINPRNVQLSVGEGIFGFLDTQSEFHKVVQRVEFDVALTASSATETKGGIGLTVGFVALGSQGKSDSEDSSVSRIKFSIPMLLPMEDAPHDFLSDLPPTGSGQGSIDNP